MKVFLDTNVFAEFVGRRNQFVAVSKIIDAVLEKHLDAYISSGSIYTLTYIFERGLKMQDVHKPELTYRLRELLAEVLSMSTLISLSHSGAEVAVADEASTDIEDSFQYRCALENRCDALITINRSDFINADQSNMEILTPKEFAEVYL